MTPIDCFRRYLALKNHFTKLEYNVLEEIKVPVPVETYNKVKNKKFFDKLATEYIDSEISRYLIANLIYHKGTHLFDSIGKRVYNEYTARINNLDYLFESELHDILYQSEKLNKDPFDSSEGYSIILKMYLGSKISPETLVILNKFENFVDNHDANLKDDYLWEDVKLLIVKYQPFIRVAHKLETYESKFKTILK